MYVDPSGNFAISTFLIMFAVSALATWVAGELFGHQLVGGLGSTANGVGAISTGISLMAFGPWGIAAGIVLIGIGAATAAFGVGQIAGNIGMRYAANVRLNTVMKNPELIQNYSKFQFKTYARYSNEWKLLAARNGKGMRALSTVNNGNSIRYGYGINNAEHFYGSYYWIVANGAGKFRFPFI